MIKKNHNYISDIELVEHCLRYDSNAQRVLYDRYIDIMYSTAYRYVQNHQDTQDVLQEGFTKVYKYLQRFDQNKGDLKYWIRKIIIRSAIDHINRRKALQFSDKDLIILEVSIELKSDTDIDYILNFIASLNERERIIFNMHEIEGYTHNEIADILNINVNSSRVYLSRAKSTLQKKIINMNAQTI